MVWWDWEIFLKALIFEVIVPLCLQGAAQVLLFFFHFPDMFRISGKLPPILLTAIRLAWLSDRHLDWKLWIENSSEDDFLMEYHAIHLYFLAW